MKLRVLFLYFASLIILSSCSSFYRIDQPDTSFYPAIERMFDDSRSIVLVMRSNNVVRDICDKANMAVLHYRMKSGETVMHESFASFIPYSKETGSLIEDYFLTPEFIKSDLWAARLFLTGTSKNYVNNEIVTVSDLDFDIFEARIAFEKMGVNRSRPVCISPLTILPKSKIVSLLSAEQQIEVDKFRSKSDPGFYLEFVQP